MTTPTDVLKWHAELDAEVEPHPAFSLYPGSTALLVIDLQERLGAAMPDGVFDRVVHNTRLLLQVARRLDIPVLSTEQYPKGLGPTVGEIRELLPEGHTPVEKLDFSCGHLPGVRDVLRERDRRQVVVVGQETHVCVFQSVRHLVERGYFVHVAQDATCSRRKSDWRSGLHLMDALGGTLTTTETVVFDLLKSAGHEAFREVSGWLK